MEFDPKKARLTHFFEKELERGKHTFNLEVTDYKDNTSNYIAEFIY